MVPVPGVNKGFCDGGQSGWKHSDRANKGILVARPARLNPISL